MDVRKDRRRGVLLGMQRQQLKLQVMGVGGMAQDRTPAKDNNPPVTNPEDMSV